MNSYKYSYLKFDMMRTLELLTNMSQELLIWNFVSTM